MSKAANISWGNATRSRSRSSERVAARRTLPTWASGLLLLVMFSVIFLALNYRGIVDAREEARQNELLKQKVQSLLDETLVLQEEIHTLRTDKKVIEREAGKIGLDLKAQTSSVSSK